MSAERVLVVEDELAIAELLCGVIDMHGYQSRLAVTGVEGLQQVDDWNPELVLLDIMLPDMDGFEVCRSIRDRPALRQPGIVMLTGMLNQEGRLRGFRSGTDRFLSKPFDVATLVSQIESVLREYRLDQETGLRQSVHLPTATREAFDRALARLLVDLAQATPLPTVEIDALGSTLSELGQRIGEWHRSHPPQSAWRLACRVFRDRIETRLECDDTAQPPETDRLHELFRLPSNDDDLQLGGPLADRIEFPDHGSIAVLTRHFATRSNTT
jgi:DNA-binding response OmpR family regulator